MRDLSTGNALANEKQPVTSLYRPIPLATLVADSIADFDIYVQMAGNEFPVLFRSKTLPMSTDVLHRLSDNKHESILIPTSQGKEYALYLERHLETVLTDENVPVVERSQVLYSTAHTMVENILANPESTDMMKSTKDLVASTAGFLLREKSAFEHLVGLVSYDYYTYTHSVNVFVYSFSLASRADIADKKTLLEFGEGTLLHDIGKSTIDPKVLRAKGKLTDDQWKLMKQHPVTGYEILKDHGMFSELALEVTRHHHEKMRGGGYPDNLSANRLAPLVRVSTIADIFDALTTRRSYKEPMSTYRALSLMHEEMYPDLDPDLFKTFVELMGNPQG
jgi:putative nucleotidyltransferase with HDIG domain